MRKVLITEAQFRQILNESLSRYIYHFCPISTLLSILKTNAFILSHVDTGIRDKEISGGYDFYMSFTREHTDKVGYVQYKNYCFTADEDSSLNDNQFFNVRISVNGELLGANYRGEPVNYHNKENRNNKQQEWANGDPVKLIQIRQSEDRLLSNKPVIENAGRYIERIDVLLHPDENGKLLKSVLENCAKILRYNKTEAFRNKIFIYDNRRLFNAPQAEGYVNDKILEMLKDENNYFGDYYDTEQNKVKTNAPGKYEYYMNQNISDRVVLKRGKEALKPLTDGQILSLASMLKFLLISGEISEEQLPETINYIYTMRDRDGSNGITEKEKKNITKIVLKPMSPEDEIDFISRFREKVYKWFSQSFKGDVRSIYAYTMAIYGNVLRNRGLNKVQDMAKEELKKR